jgi:hypothetical protein
MCGDKAMSFKETIIDLNGLWYCQRSNILQLLDALVKRYLLFEVTNAVKVKNFERLLNFNSKPKLFPHFNQYVVLYLFVVGLIL